MPWILKGLLLAAKSKRGREVLFAGMLAAIELAKSERARKTYSNVHGLLVDPRARAFICKGGVQSAFAASCVGTHPLLRVRVPRGYRRVRIEDPFCAAPSSAGAW